MISNFSMCNGLAENGVDIDEHDSNKCQNSTYDVNLYLVDYMNS